MSGKSSKNIRRANEVARNSSPHQGIQAAVKEQTAVFHSGPLPTPQTLAEYKELVPDAPERIFAMAEREQAARLEKERHLTEALQIDAAAARGAQKRADIISVLFFLSCLITGCILLYSGFSEKLAAALLGAPVLASIAAFLKARVQKKMLNKS